MTITEELLESIKSKDIQKFTELINHPSLYINDIFESGLLHYLLENEKDLPLQFYKLVIEHLNTDVNKFHAKLKLPPLLCTDREEIWNLLLGNPKCNVNIRVGKKKLLEATAIQKYMALFKRLAGDPRMDISVFYSIILTDNEDIWDILLANPKFDINKKISGTYLLGIVLEHNNIPLFKKLLSLPRIDLSQEEETEESEIVFLKWMDNMDIFTLFLESGKMDVNSIGWNGICNPLLYSLKMRFLDQTKVLIEKGADMDMQSEDSAGGTKTLAEFMIKSGIPLYSKLVLDNFGKIKNKTRFLNMALFARNYDLVSTFLEKKCEINDLFLGKISKNIGIIEKVIVAADNGALVNIQSLQKTVFLSGNNALIQQLLRTKIILTIKKQLITSLKTARNVQLILAILSVDDIVLDDVKGIFIENEFRIFMALLQFNKFDLITHLLDISKVQLPDFPPVSILIQKGEFALVQKLIKENGVIIQTPADVTFLIENKKTDIIRLLFQNSQIKKHMLEEEILVELFIMFETDEDIITKLFNVLNRERVVVLLRTLSNEFPEKLISLIQKDSFNNDVLFYIIEDPDDMELYKRVTLIDILGIRILFDIKDDYKEQLLSHLISHKIFDDLSGVDKLLDYIIEENNISMLEFMRSHPDLVGIVDLSDLLSKYPEFVLDHLETIMGFNEFDFTDIIPQMFNTLTFNPELLEKACGKCLFEKVFSHRDFNPQLQEPLDDLTICYQLHLFIDCINNLLSHSTDLDISAILTELLAVYPVLINHPEIDINAIDDKHFTGLDYLVRTIQDFEDVQYGIDRPIHAMIKMMLENPKLDMNLNLETLEMVCKKNMGFLFTHIISRREFDFNRTGLLRIVCINRNDVFLNILLTMPIVDVNFPDEGTTALHVCIDQNYELGAILLIQAKSIDLTMLDPNGNSYAQLAVTAGMTNVIELLSSKGVIDERHVRMEREAAEYDQRMAAIGRKKRGKLKSLIDIFDQILKERENPEALIEGQNITLFNKCLCPFCMVFLEKDDPGGCIYVTHKCESEVRNEELMAKYLGPDWATVQVEICCTCGRPGKNHGHFQIVPDGQTSSLSVPGIFVNYWKCDEHSGGGGKLEMTTRLVAMLSHLKSRVDTGEHLEDNAELAHVLTSVADKALWDEAIKTQMKARAISILARKQWNSNSEIPPYTKFNAPVVEEAPTVLVAEEREPIAYFHNGSLEPKLICTYCQKDRDHMYRPHARDSGYICSVCLYTNVCVSTHDSVTCQLGCKPKKQIHKDDVEALLVDGEPLCEAMVAVAARNDEEDEDDEEELAQARLAAAARQAAFIQAARNARARHNAEAEDNDSNSEIEDGEIRD